MGSRTLQDRFPFLELEDTDPQNYTYLADGERPSLLFVSDVCACVCRVCACVFVCFRARGRVRRRMCSRMCVRNVAGCKFARLVVGIVRIHQL